MRSVKRVAHTVCNGNSLAYDAFKAIGYQVLKAESANEIGVLFQVLKGELPLEAAIKFLPKSKVLQNYSPHHNPSNWQSCGKWSERWTRPRHLSKYNTAVKFVYYCGLTYFHFTLFTHCHIQRCYQQLPVAWIQPPSPLFPPLQMLWSPCTEFQRANVRCPKGGPYDHLQSGHGLYS